MSTVDPLLAAVERLRAAREAAKAHQAASIIADGVWAQPQRFGVWLSMASGEALEQLLEASAALENFDDEAHDDPLTVWADLKAAWRSKLSALASHLTEGGHDTVIETEYVEIERSKLEALLDVAVSSMDFGSGFWDQKDADAARWAAEVLGQCPNSCTPTNILMHFPPCEGTWRYIDPPYIGRDGRSYPSAPSYQHVEHDTAVKMWPRRQGRWERWQSGEWVEVAS